MPANLPPQYFEAEKELKAAKTPQEKILVMERLLQIIPKHKGTEKLQALYKTKISKLKTQAQKRPLVSRHKSSFSIDKAGAGQVVIVGPPNSGKSMLVRALTNALPEVGDYPFTTRSAYPAMMKYEDIQIQLIDSPPITSHYMEAWHAELIKNADRVLVLLDLTNPEAIDEFLVLLKKLKEKRIEIVPDLPEEPSELLLYQKKALIAGNKCDLSQAEKSFSINGILDPGFSLVRVSALKKQNVDELKEKLYNLLDVLRVYSKTPGKKPTLDEPFVFKRGSTLLDMAKTVHKDFAMNLKFARIWGKGKYQGQKVNRNYILQDEDVIELHL